MRTEPLEAILDQAHSHGVAQMITVGTSPEDWSLYHKLAKGHPGRVFYTVGLHPCDVDEHWADQCTQLAPFFTQDPLPLAIGEVGLDYFHLPKDKAHSQQLVAWQKEAFIYQLDLAYQLDVPVVVHSRGAFEDCLAMIDASPVDWNKVVFHCFSEGPNEVRALNERGGWASFTGVITYKNAQAVRDAALAQGIERLMLETDAPYLCPEPMRGKKNSPAYTQVIGEYCAGLFNYGVAQFAERVARNTQQFFGLPKA